MTNEDARLIVVVAVAKKEAVQCQCNDCGQRIYAAIHILWWPDGTIECWGSRCYSRDFSGNSGYKKAQFPEFHGRRLGAEERMLLTENRDALIARIRATIEAEESAWVAERAAQAEQVGATAARIPPPPFTQQQAAFVAKRIDDRVPPELTQSHQDRINAYAAEIKAAKQARPWR